MLYRKILINNGFTLIEIMVVVAILGILATVVVINVSPSMTKSVEAKIRHDFKTIESALELYKIDNFAYPTTDQGLEALVTKPGNSSESSRWQRHLKRLPKDPWDKPYQYLSPGQHGEVDIYTLGADGVAGGERENKDFGNWNL